MDIAPPAVTTTTTSLALTIDSRTRVTLNLVDGAATVDGSVFAYNSSPWSWNVLVQHLAMMRNLVSLRVRKAEWLPYWIRARMPRYERLLGIPIELCCFTLTPQPPIGVAPTMSRRLAHCVVQMIRDPGCAPASIGVFELAHNVILYRVHIESLMLDVYDLLALAHDPTRTGAKTAFAVLARECLDNMRYVHRPAFHIMYWVLSCIDLLA